MTKQKTYRWALHLALALPLAILAWRWGMILGGADPRAAGLTSEPVDATINRLGLWTLRWLWLCLCISPLRQITGQAWLASWRRPAGLWAFAYGLIHLSVYFGLDQLGSFALLWRDVVKHKFVLLGMSSLLLLAPLAITSTRGWQKRLGGRRWQSLHRLVFVAAVLASIHFILRVKGFQIEPWIYAAVLAGLILWRMRKTTGSLRIRR